MERPLRMGAVAYDPKVVPIWDGIRDYVAAAGAPMDYVLFSNYEAQVDALLEGFVDVAWNTNLAYVRAHRRTAGAVRALAMRDTDVDFASVIVVRPDAGVDSLDGLRGRTLALGSRDSGHAAILPLYFLAREGLDWRGDLRLTRFDLDVGKHGDTGASEAAVLEAVASGAADAGAIGDPFWAMALEGRTVDPDRVRALWTTPTYHHCNFTVLASTPEERTSAWVEALLGMDYDEQPFGGRQVPSVVSCANPHTVPMSGVGGRTRPAPDAAHGYRMRIRARYDGGDLAAAEGLLVAVARLLDPLEEGDALEVSSEHATVADDLRAWCRRAGHRLVSAERTRGRTRLLIARGGVRRTLADPPEWGVRIPRRDGRVDMRDWRRGRHGEVRDEVPAGGALAPRGAAVEAGAPLVEFSLRRRSDVWAESLAELYEQATAGQWVGARDIPWDELAPGDDEVERAVCQIMTFLAENEYAALYVPARFLGRVHPHYAEAALFMATVLADEARHIEVFTKRALANGGGLGVAAASTQLSLASLFEAVDFSTASFLLGVLGEGTFLDLLSFLETYAPDGATREICRRARLDEARHVRFGIAHARLALESQPGAGRRLRAAVESRADFLKSVSGVGALVEESLIVYAAGGLGPSGLREGVRRVAGLYATMHASRVRRLQAAGFEADDADHISRLHTPNFM